MKSIAISMVVQFFVSSFLSFFLTGTVFAISPVKLNVPLITGSSVSEFHISPTSNRVIYSANQDNINIVEHYSVPISRDEAPIKISPVITDGDDLQPLTNPISPNGDWVVFSIRQSNGTGNFIKTEFIYSTPIDGSAEPLKFNTLPANTLNLVSTPLISRDSNWVLYEITLFPVGPVRTLFSTPIDGSKAPIKLVEGPFGAAIGGKISPDNNRVVYSNDSGLFSIAIDGSSMPVRLTPPGSNGGDQINFGEITFSPDGNQVVYTSDEGTGTSIYSVPTDGSALPRKLNTTQGTDRVVENDFLISPDGSRVIYRIRKSSGPSPHIIYSVPLDGSAMPVKLTPSFPFTASDFPFTARGVLAGFKISPDGSRIVYVANLATNEAFQETNEFYSVPIDGSAIPVKLSTSVPTALRNRNFSFSITPDSRWVAYNTPFAALINELNSVPIEGGAPIKLSPPISGSGTDFLPPQFSSNGRRVVFSAELETDGVRELYSVPIDGSVIPVKLSAPLVAGGNIKDFKVSLDDDYVVYRADQDTDDVLELYASPLVFDVSIQDLIYIIERFPEEDLDAGLRSNLISILQDVDEYACTGILDKAINLLQVLKTTIEEGRQKINKSTADIINAGADYSLALWNNLTNQELNASAFDFIVDNNKLIDSINDLPSADLAESLKNSLILALESTEQETNNSDIAGATFKVQVFKDEVESLRGNGINNTTADSLVSKADNLINHLNAMLLNVQACPI